MKTMWRILDSLVNISAFLALYYWFGWKAALLGFGIALWNFLDGQVRARW